EVDGHAALLAATQHAFNEAATNEAATNEAATWIAWVCWDENIANANTAHHRVYGETRLNFGLGAQLAVCARAIKALALEDLSGIRERVTVRHEQRYERHSWAFYQLRQFLSYKAAWASVPLHLADPQNTGRTCSACGHCEKANRRSQDAFLCQRRGF